MTICVRPYNHGNDLQRQAVGLLILPADEVVDPDFGLIPEFRVPLCGPCSEGAGSGSGFRIFESRQEPVLEVANVRGEKAR